ncbi:MAG TPA: hypothetical protein VFH68_17485 [Polyangia bacterium]|jgi:hypothetical protein|nr:hypothetical protein [Polyangia bacterium]
MTQIEKARLAALVFTLWASVASVGCSKTSEPGATANDAGHDQAQVLDTGSGACPARPDLPAAAPSCNNVVNAATAVPFTAATGTAPTPMGGTIQDGLYESTRAEAYGSTTGGGRRITFVILEGATRMLWAGEVLDASGTTVTSRFRADTAISVSGTRINFAISCVSTTPSPIPAALDFTVSGQNLVLSLGSAVTTYTRRGCAP